SPECISDLATDFLGALWGLVSLCDEAGADFYATRDQIYEGRPVDDVLKELWAAVDRRTVTEADRYRVIAQKARAAARRQGRDRTARALDLDAKIRNAATAYRSKYPHSPTNSTRRLAQRLAATLHCSEHTIRRRL